MDTEKSEKFVKLSTYVNLILALFISGSAVVVNKMMVSKLPVFLAAELGIVIGLVILIPFCLLVTGERPKYDIRTHMIMFLQAFCGVFLYRILTFEGLKRSSAISSGLITGGGPVLVLLLARIFLKEKISFRKIIAILFTVFSICLINLSSIQTSQGYGSFSGNLLIMAAVLCEALFSILSKTKCMPVTPLWRTTIIVTDAFLLLLPLSIHDAMNYDFSKMDIKTVCCIGYYGIFVTFLSYVFWFRGIAKTFAVNAAVITGVVPLSSVLLAVLLLHEKLSVAHLISLFFILAAIGISYVPDQNN